MKIIIIIIIMNKSQGTTLYHRLQKLASAKARIVMVDFKFDANRQPPEVGGLQKLTESLEWWVEECVPTLHNVTEKPFISKWKKEIWDS